MSCSPITTSLTVTGGRATGSICSCGTTMSTCLPRVSGLAAPRLGSGTARVSSTVTWMRCQFAGPSSAGIAAHSSGCWNQLVPSSRLRSRWSPGRWSTTTGCTASGCTMSESATWKISHGPTRREQRQLGLRLGRRLGLRRCAPSGSARRAPACRARPWRRRCCRNAARAPGWSSAWRSPPWSGSGTAWSRTPRRRGPPSTRCSRRSSAAAASAPSSCRTGRCPRCSPTRRGRSRWSGRSRPSSGRRRSTPGTAGGPRSRRSCSATNRRPGRRRRSRVFWNGPHAYTVLVASWLTTRLPPGSTSNMKPRISSTRRPTPPTVAEPAIQPCLGAWSPVAPQVDGQRRRPRRAPTIISR